MDALQVWITVVIRLAVALSAGELFALGIKEPVKDDAFCFWPRYLERFHNIQ